MQTGACNLSANCIVSFIAPLNTTPAPLRITGNFEFFKRSAAVLIVSSPPLGNSNSINSGISISTSLFQKSLGIFIWAGAEAFFALDITLFRVSAIL